MHTEKSVNDMTVEAHSEDVARNVIVFVTVKCVIVKKIMEMEETITSKMMMKRDRGDSAPDEQRRESWRTEKESVANREGQIE